MADMSTGKKRKLNLRKRSPSELNPPGEPSFNEVLINTVRDYPALYSTSRRPYDGVDRQVIWKQVADRIGRNVSPGFAKKRWLQLRDRYRKELKIAIAHNFTQPQKWNHFALLKWLDPHLQGSVPITGADHMLESSNSMSYLDDLIKCQTSYNDYTTSFATQHLDEKIESADSDVLDEVKPMLSALQSVLAATEQKIANERSSKEPLENIFEVESSSGSMMGESLVSSVTPTLETASPPSDASLDGPSVVSALLSRERANPITLQQIAFQGGETEDSSESVVIRASPPVTSAGLELTPSEERTQLRAPNAIKSQLASHPYRFRARNLNNNKYRSAISSNKAGVMLPNRHTAPLGAGAGAALSATDDWFNNEEMLFARIVGLRLQKMDVSRRKVVRAQIMNLLDEEIDQDMAEAGASVAE